MNYYSGFPRSQLEGFIPSSTQLDFGGSSTSFTVKQSPRSLVKQAPPSSLVGGLPLSQASFSLSRGLLPNYMLSLPLTYTLGMLLTMLAVKEILILLRQFPNEFHAFLVKILGVFFPSVGFYWHSHKQINKFKNNSFIISHSSIKEQILLSVYVAGFPSPKVSDISCYGYCEIMVFTVKHKSV